MIFPDWPAPVAVKAVSTTREGGYSRSPYDGLNLAMHVGDREADVRANRESLGSALDLPAEPLWLEQVHGAGVVNADEATGVPAADASYSRQPGAVCCVMTADCLPVLFCDRAGTRVAAAHAGWRGLAGGVLEATVQALDTGPGELMAWLGPAIGPDAFEVGEDVRGAFVAQQADAERAFLRGTDDRWLADIYRLARLRLAAVGVEQVYGGGNCTYRDAARFYSFRREPVTGRMATLIWLANQRS